MMRKLLIPIACTALLLPLLCGCGEDDDFQAGNRLTVESIADEDGNSVPIFNAVVKTDDSGRDGDPAVEDPDGSQDDGFPDFGEEVLEPLSDDLAVMTLKNEARLGVDPGVDLSVFRIDVSFFDRNGNARTFAPTVTYTVTETVPNDGTVDVTFVIIPVDMKVDGLQTIFLTGTPAEIDAVRQWTVVVDVFARDIRNDDTVHAQGLTTVRMINPMVEEIAE